MPRNLQAELNQLSEQQALITAGLRAMDEGKWLAAEFGAESLEAIVGALNPTWTSSPREPLYVEPPEPDAELHLEWIGSPNHYHGRNGWVVSALVIHTMAGTLAGCDSWFQNPASQVSAHFGIGLDGQQHQYVSLPDGAWANGILEFGNSWAGTIGNSSNPNYQTVSVETEDNGSGATAVTDEQYSSTLAVCRYALEYYPDIEFLLTHTVISPSSRPQCCGDRWVASGRFQMLADDLGLQAVTE